MKVFKLAVDLTEALAAKRSESKSIGFVPTMGALHQGHISLIEKAAFENDVVVVSIFVNPRQFNDKSDYEKYPRNVESDLKLIDETKCDFVFLPDYNQLFSDQEKLKFDFKCLDLIMEGEFRPGHFQGVVDVVHSLFRIVNPQNAYFGQKDFQQLKIIELMAHDCHPSVNIVSCPIVRESDGMAMSSRNARLDVSSRLIATNISKALLGLENVARDFNVEQVKSHIIKCLKKHEEIKLEYVEVCSINDLRPLNNEQKAVGNVVLLAVWCGGVRLIDNFYLKV